MDKEFIHHLPISFFFEKLYCTSLNVFYGLCWQLEVQSKSEKKFFFCKAKTSLKGGIKESEKVSEEDQTKVILRHGEVCVKGEALEEVNEMK